MRRRVLLGIFKPELSISPDTINLAYENGSATVSVVSNTTWEVVASS